MRLALRALAILLCLASLARAETAAGDAEVRAFCGANSERLAASTPAEFARWLRTEGRADFLPNARIRVHADGKTETFSRDRYLRETAEEIAALRSYDERVNDLRVLRRGEEVVCVADVEQRAALAHGDGVVHLRGRLQTRAWVVEKGGRLRVSRLEAYQVEKKAVAGREKGA